MFARLGSDEQVTLVRPDLANRYYTGGFPRHVNILLIWAEPPEIGVACVQRYTEANDVLSIISLFHLNLLQPN